MLAKISYEISDDRNHCLLRRRRDSAIIYFNLSTIAMTLTITVNSRPTLSLTPEVSPLNVLGEIINFAICRRVDCLETQCCFTPMCACINSMHHQSLDGSEAFIRLAIFVDIVQWTYHSDQSRSFIRVVHVITCSLQCG